MEKQRIRHSVFMGEEIWDKVSNTYKAEGFRTHSEFIEMAIIHYCAYLASNNTDDFLPKLIGQVMDAKFSRQLDRLYSLLFKFAVEQDIVMHIIASDTDIDDVTLGKLRNHCVKEVMESHADISFLNALRYQKEIVIDPNWE